MSIKKSKYLLVYITPLVVIFSLFQQDIWTFTALFVLFGLLPFLELFTQGSTQNLSEVEEEMAKSDDTYDWVLYSLVPLQYFSLVLFLYQISYQQLSSLSLVGITIAYGLTCGVLGINAAHELGHRQTWYEQWMSKALLMTTLYMHFFIEHKVTVILLVGTDLQDDEIAKVGKQVFSIVEGLVAVFNLFAVNAQSIVGIILYLDSQITANRFYKTRSMMDTWGCRPLRCTSRSALIHLNSC